MKKLKAMLCAITALCFCTCYVSNAILTETNIISVNAEEDVATSGTCGDNSTWNFDETTKILTISGTGTIWNSWNNLNEDITTVIIEDGITAIGYGTFYACSNLESITILNPTCYFVERELIDGGPGYPVQDTIPSTTVIYGYEFSSAQAYAKENGNEFISLGEKEITGELGTNLTWTFDTETGTLTISGTGNMKNFTYTTNGLTWAYLSKNIKKVVIQDGVTSIGDMAFCGYSNLESVSIPDGLTSIGSYAFGYCTSLESVVLPESVKYIGYNGFCSCSSLEAITIKNPDCEINGDNILGYCTISDTAVIYGYENSTAQAYALDWDKQFISIGEVEDITGTCGDNLTWSYNRTTRTLTISGTGEMTSESKSWSSLRKVVKTLVIENGVTSISYDAFQGYSRLESVTLPDSIKTIGAGAFDNCPALESITIPDSVTTVGMCAFELCSSLKSVSLSNSITEIDYGTFENCSHLESIIIPDSVTTIGNYAFKKCHSLKSITIPENVNRIRVAFQDCYRLESITIENPDCVIADGASTIYEKATIYGYANSTAQAYAEKYDREFILIGEELEATETLETAKGDINGDNEIDINDVVFVNKAVLGKEILTEQQMKSADIDNDGYVKATDTLLILKYVVKLIDSFD